MAKETEKRLIKTLKFLKEPQGSTIPTIVKAMNGEGPQVSLKRIVQTLKGCLENGTLKVSEGRVKLRQVNLISDSKMEGENQVQEPCGRTKSGCAKPICPNKPVCPMKSTPKCPPKKAAKPKNPKACPKEEKSDNESPAGEEGESNDGETGKQCPECPKCPKCPRKGKRGSKCVKKKPKCQKPKRKPKCQKPKRKQKSKHKKCAKKKVQPYCKKKKKCDS